MSYRPYDSNRRRARRRAHSSDMSLILFIVVPLLLIGGIAFALINATHVVHRTCTVNDKDRTSVSDGNGNNSSDARIYTDDCGTLHVADSWLSWNFHSADTYASIKPGKRYEFTTRGHRIPFLSMFPNVVEAKEVPQ